MKIVFMGTPEFAVPSLKKLIDAGYNIEAVVTQPDKPKGRGMQIVFSPVKEFALKMGIEVLQPDKIKGNEEFANKLKKISPDIIIVIAYGKILPETILNLSPLGCINVHASLLPKYRGAAPINWAIINGEKETGITTMLMDKGLDTGDILIKKAITILENDDAQTIHDKLSVLGGEILLDTLKKLSDGTLRPVKQNNSESSYAPIIDKTMGYIDWSKSAFEIRNLIRGLSPWPGCYTFYNNKMLKMWKADIIYYDGKELCGTVLSSNNELIVKCGVNALSITEIQSEGTKRMSIKEYLRGHNIEKEVILK